MQGTLTMEEFFEEQAREAAGVVAQNAVLLEEVIENNAATEFLENREIDGHRQRAHAAARKAELLDRGAACRDARLAVNDAAIVEPCDEVDVRQGGGENAAANGQHFAGHANGFGEIAGDVSERCEEEIP